jgi:DNA mismatch endonuclease (patch repair protein)
LAWPCKLQILCCTRTQWWTNKINRNKANDEKAAKALKKDGWKVINVWECDLKPAKVEKMVVSLLKKI